MFTTVLMCAALVGQCGSSSSCGSVYYGRSYGPVYSRVYGYGTPGYRPVIVYQPDQWPDERPEKSSVIKTSTQKTGQRMVTCYYRNKGTVSRKGYAQARVYLGGPEDLINVPIINGYSPALLVTRDNSGKIVSMVCDYGKKAKYEGGTLIYGKPPLSCEPASGDKQVLDIEPVPTPVPSEETHPIPRGEEAPPESSPLPAEKADPAGEEKTIPGMPSDIKVIIEPPANKPVEGDEKLGPVPSIE